MTFTFDVDEQRCRLPIVNREGLYRILPLWPNLLSRSASRRTRRLDRQ
jgi:hypothetical protein